MTKHSDVYLFALIISRRDGDGDAYRELVRRGYGPESIPVPMREEWLS